jgi:hypothetical protein
VAARDVPGEHGQRDRGEDDDDRVPADQQADLRAGPVEVVGDQGEQADRQQLGRHERERGQ